MIISCCAYGKQGKKFNIQSDDKSDCKDVKIEMKDIQRFPVISGKNITQTIWNTYIGHNVPVIQCLVCGKKDINMLNFECVKILPESIQIENLRPVCSLCKKSSGKSFTDELCKIQPVGHPFDCTHETETSRYVSNIKDRNIAWGKIVGYDKAVSNCSKCNIVICMQSFDVIDNKLICRKCA